MTGKGAVEAQRAKLAVGLLLLGNLILRLESGNIVPGAFTPVLRQALDESSGQLRERKNGSMGECKAE